MAFHRSPHLDIVLHLLDDTGPTSLWPLPVMAVAKWLPESLPCWLSSQVHGVYYECFLNIEKLMLPKEPYLPISPKNRYLLHELSCIQTSRSDPSNSRKYLWNVLDWLLMTVHDLRDLCNRENQLDMHPNAKTCYIADFVQTAMLARSPNAKIR